tara:strand:- start:13500 stop:13898 length:399 start_codon:yes stop_codon:yes gene_type:complete
MKFAYLFLLLLLSAGQSVVAEEDLQSELVQNASRMDFEAILDSIEDAVPERTTTGTIEAIDLAGRAAIIGGHLYHFGPATEADPLIVKLLGVNYGSLEMLSAGMDVEVLYFQSPAGDRIGNQLTQIESSEQH